MILYHGSYTEINAIDLKKSKPYKDFGRAFYLTKYYEQAKFWANRLGREHKKEGIVTEFEFNILELQAIDLYFLSKTYGKLIDENTEFYKKTWQEIYELLKSELIQKRMI